MDKRKPEYATEFIEAMVKEAARERKMRSILSRMRAEQTLERIEPIVRQAENEKLLRERRARIHARAKRIAGVK